MKQNIGELSEADLKARRRFWNKKGFFGEPMKKQIECSSMKMQKLVKALKIFSIEEINRKFALQNARADTSQRIRTQSGMLANQILITQYQHLKYFSYGFGKNEN